MTDTLTSWSAGPFVLTGYQDRLAPCVRFTRGAAGEVTAAFEVEMPDVTFQALFLRYDPARQSVDVINHFDLTDDYSLDSTAPIPENMQWQLDVAADPGSPQPDALFGLMTRINPNLGLVHTPSN